MGEASVLYQEWLQDEMIDEATKNELRSIADKPNEIEDRFYRNLEFGTGGLRGVLGAGTNRMNIYTVGLATQGLAHYLLKQPGVEKSAVIACDSRNQSPEFALETALVLAGNGIRAYVFESLRPTPELSFAVRYLKAASGIVITASHNPPEYNGYKAYDSNGCQYLPDEAKQIIGEIQQLRSFREIKKLSRQEAEQAGLLHWIGDDVDHEYMNAVSSVSRFAAGELPQKDMQIVYTPLHGAGNLPVRAALAKLGFRHVSVVPQQEKPDANFSTVASPNPEEQQAFALAIKLAKAKSAEVVVGTDPDCDRMGVVVKNSEGEYVVLTGNQAGAILTDYLASRMQQSGELPVNGAVIKTIVTSELGAVIAKSYGLDVINTLTGFKYIGEKMTEFEQTGSHTFVFGYEESYGYLAGTHCRDKDAVVASMLICEAAAFYKEQGRTLYDVLQDLYKKHGYYQEKLVSVTLKGKEGIEKMGQIMNDLRSSPPAHLSGVQVTEVQDYEKGLNGLPRENVLKFILADGSWFCLRPSGTEPKIKLYFSVVGESLQDAVLKVNRLADEVVARING